MELSFDNFTRYLSAKRTVDDRALNKDVWAVFRREYIAENEIKTVPRILEIGAGIGTMFERCFEWGLLGSCSYTAIDSMPDNTAEAARRLAKWAPSKGFSLKIVDPAQFLLEKSGVKIHLHLQSVDFFDFAAREENSAAWDVIIANAFLDLLDVPTSLPILFSLLKSRALFYFSINFDGGTSFEPSIEPTFDDLVERLYHQTMDSRIINGKPSGDSRTGRHLFRHLRHIGAEVLGAGSSDWVIFPKLDGYGGDEAYFLHFIINTIGNALRGHPELNGPSFEEWLRIRHEQVENNNLVYVAHQLDFVGRAP